MAIYLTLIFIGWGMIITAFLLMFHWLRKDMNMLLEARDRQIYALEQKMSHIIALTQQVEKKDWFKSYR